MCLIGWNRPLKIPAEENSKPCGDTLYTLAEINRYGSNEKLQRM
jgi:hypothetical protein